MKTENTEEPKQLDVALSKVLGWTSETDYPPLLILTKTQRQRYLKLLDRIRAEGRNK